MPRGGAGRSGRLGGDRGRTLQIDYTLTDPKSWEGEWTYTKRWNRVDDRDIAEVTCYPDLNEHMPSTKANIGDAQ